MTCAQVSSRQLGAVPTAAALGRERTGRARGRSCRTRGPGGRRGGRSGRSRRCRWWPLEVAHRALPAVRTTGPRRRRRSDQRSRLTRCRIIARAPSATALVPAPGRDDDGDAAAGRLGDVDPVDADAGARQDPQLRHPVEGDSVDDGVGPHDRADRDGEVVRAGFGDEANAGGRCPDDEVRSDRPRGRRRRAACRVAHVASPRAARRSAVIAAASRVESEPMARNCQPCCGHPAGCGAVGDQQPAALPCRARRRRRTRCRGPRRTPGP